MVYNFGGEYFVSLKLIQFGGVAHFPTVDVDVRFASSDNRIVTVRAGDKREVTDHIACRTQHGERCSRYVGNESAILAFHHRAGGGYRHFLQHLRVRLQANVIFRLAGKRQGLIAYVGYFQQMFFFIVAG